MNYKIKQRQLKISKIIGRELEDKEFLPIHDYIKNNILNTKIYCVHHSYYFFNAEETQIDFYYDWGNNNFHVSHQLRLNSTHGTLNKITDKRKFLADVFEYHYKFIDNLTTELESRLMFFIPRIIKDLTIEDVRNLMIQKSS